MQGGCKPEEIIDNANVLSCIDGSVETLPAKEAAST